MDGVLEKITLYDILGYLVPGSLLMVLFLYGTDPKNMPSDLGQWGDYKGALYFAFLLISYLIGIALSEVMAWVWKLFMPFDGMVRKCLNKESKIMEKIPTKQIVDALLKSGINDDKDLIESRVKVEKDFMEHYFSYVYGIIQKSDDYKRIHNYASAYVLYKNVAGALIAGACVVLCNNTANRCLGILCIIMSFVFVVRGVRFQDKRNGYAIIWFVEKFTGK